MFNLFYNINLIFFKIILFVRDLNLVNKKVIKLSMKKVHIKIKN